MSDTSSPSPSSAAESRGVNQHDAAGMDRDQLAEARHYGRLGLACTIVDRVLDLAFLAVAALVLARPVDAWLQRSSVLERYASLRLAVFVILMIAAHLAVSFPLSVYSGFRLEHRFGLSRMSFGAWLWRYTKQSLLVIGLGLPLILGLYWLIWTTGAWWWLVAAGAFFLVSVVLGQLMPVVILPLFYKVERLDAPELTERIRRVAEGSGLSIEGVYRLGLSAETVKANAALAGLGRTRRVILGDTLLDNFTPDEIEVVFAHEIGHHVFRHIPKMILFGLLTSAAGFWVCDRLLTAWIGAPAGPFDYSAMPVHALPMLMLVFTVFMMLLDPLANAISRHYERQCDGYALQRTQTPDAYRAAFRKLARLNKDDPDPPWLEVFLFHSHPPIGERLAMADKGPAQK